MDICVDVKEAFDDGINENIVWIGVVEDTNKHGIEKIRLEIRAYVRGVGRGGSPSPPEMEFSISSRFRDCLSRQIGEALKINFSKDVLLNSKGEYLSNSVSRLTITEDAWERRERTRLEDEQEELDKKKVEAFRRLKSVPGPNIVLETQPCILVGGGEVYPTLTVNAQLPEPCEMSTNTAKQDLSPLFETDDASEEPHACDYETDEEEFNPEANTSRGNSTRQQVYLGQSNESSGDILVIDPEYPQKQDEHP